MNKTVEIIKRALAYCIVNAEEKLSKEAMQVYCDIRIAEEAGEHWQVREMPKMKEDKDNGKA